MQETATAGQRERRRRTRDRIERAALALFRRDGFDQVTVEDVCRAAGVAPATFYRHFGTKEAVVLGYREDFLAAVADAVVATPRDLPALEQLTSMLQEFARFLERNRETLSVRDEIVLAHPGLLRGTVVLQREVESELAGGLALLRGLHEPDSTAQALAGIGVVALRMAMRAWRSGTQPSLTEATCQAMADLAALLQPVRTGASDPDEQRPTAPW